VFMVIVFVSRTVSARRQVRGRDRQVRAPEPGVRKHFAGHPVAATLRAVKAAESPGRP